jgi:hypothetical protein
MRRPIKPEWLLRLARELATGTGGAGQPRNTNLRRASSTAYYALFHAISLGTAREALPGALESEHFSYARYVSHAAIKQVCGWLSGAAPPQHLLDTVTRLRRNVGLSDVATVFTALQEGREEADYNHDADINRPSTLALVSRAEDAVATLVEQAGSDDFRAFFGLVALQTSVRR